MEALRHNFTEDQTGAETGQEQLTVEQQELLDFMRMCDENVLAAIHGAEPVAQRPKLVSYPDED